MRCDCPTFVDEIPILARECRITRAVRLLFVAPAPDDGGVSSVVVVGNLASEDLKYISREVDNS
jgi:hypothetical protein